MRLSHLLLFLIIISALSACQPANQILQSALPTLSVPATETPAPSATPSVFVTPTFFPISIPATATAPPAITVTLWSPNYLSAQVNIAIEEFNAASDHWSLSRVPGQEMAQIRLVSDDGGIPVGVRPIAFSVPFTWPWEAITNTEANEILINGSPGVEIIDRALLVPSHKALRVDGLTPFDDGYPISQPWSMHYEPDYETVASEFAPYLISHLTADRYIHLSAVGDIMLDRALGYAIEQGNVTFPFALVGDILRSADITVGNLESALGDIGQPALKSYTFRAPPEAAQALSAAGFDIVSLANNHAMDYGPEALKQAIELLRSQSVSTIGAGQDQTMARQPVILTVHDMTVAFLGYVNVPVEVAGFDTRSWMAAQDSPGLAWAEPDIVYEDVTQAQSKADLVIVVLHSGYEYVDPPSPEQSAIARAAIAAGADMVIGHHAHVLQGVEFAESGVIVYGLGNFAFEIDGDPSTAILNVWLDERGVRQLEFMPAVIQFGGQPRLAEPYESPAILDRIYRLTTPLNPG